MLKQRIRTDIDFKTEQRRWTLSTDKEWLRIKEDGEVKWCKQQGNNNKRRQSKESQTQARLGNNYKILKMSN